MGKISKLFLKVYWSTPRGWYSKKKRQRDKSRKKHNGKAWMKALSERPSLLMNRIGVNNEQLRKST